MTIVRKNILLLVLIFSGATCDAQQVIALYPGNIPGGRKASNEEIEIPNNLLDTIAEQVSIPTLTIFLPPENIASGTAVIICPGGGYHALLINREGKNVARAFTREGVAAFVLKYRLPSDRTMEDKSVGPIEDAQRAIQLVRKHARRWHIDPGKIGIMGFSAGGHLATMAGTHFDHSFIDNKEHISLRPDFMILVYPVISFTDSIGHIGSRDNLLGPSPSQAQIRYYSNELWVNSRTPPTFLVQATDDKVVPSKNSLFFYEALHRNGVPVALHLYEKGEHGFLTSPSFHEWFGRCMYWMRGRQLIR